VLWTWISSGPQAERAEPFGEPVRAEVPTGFASVNNHREAPWSLRRVCPRRVAMGWKSRPARGFREFDGLAAEAQPNCMIIDVDVVDSESADRCGPLGVEQDEQTGDPIFELEGAVVQKSAEFGVPNGFRC
jgi:hypothetical protein